MLSDVDECTLSKTPCHQNATCNNTIGSYSCTCRRGFTGDGFNICSGMHIMENFNISHATALI